VPDAPAEPTADQRRRADLAAKYQFERCCTKAFDLVLPVWERHAGGHEPDPDGPSADEIATALDHGPVAPALVDLVIGSTDHGSPLLDSFATAIIDSTPPPHNGALFVRASNAEADGRVLEAEADYTASLDADPDYTPAIYELARFASDRGDIDRAVSLYRRVGSGAQAEVGFLSGLVPDYSGVGRNEPCPCGSGRKFKQCHLGSTEVPADRAALWLFQKVLGFGYREQFASLRTGLATTALDARAALVEQADQADQADQPDDQQDDLEPDRPRALVERFENEPFILDLAVFESGIIDRFAAERAALLPPAEVDMLRDWIATERRLWEIAEVEVGHSIVFRDVISDDTVEVVERVASESVHPGELLLARIVSVQGEEQLIGQPLSVNEYERPRTVELIGSGPDAQAWADWFGWRLASAEARRPT
jgi:hypothetical protein